MFRKILSIFIVFLVGALAGNMLTVMGASADARIHDLAALNPFGAGGDERASPQDRVKESQIKVYGDKVVIDIANPKWSTFTDTNSMDPVIDSGANAIEFVPTSEDEIQIGDIVAYRSGYADVAVIHRIVDKGEDEQGVYFILKGDNNPRADPGKVRFEQIERLVIAIIY